MDFARRGERRLPARLLALAGVLALGACSMSIPSFIDAAPTGSNASANYPFDKADWTKAEPALIAAIRADAADDPAQWNNADSGRRGTVTGVGERFAKGGATCRAFVARISENGESRTVQGDACEKGGDVILSGAAPYRGA